MQAQFNLAAITSHAHQIARSIAACGESHYAAALKLGMRMAWKFAKGTTEQKQRVFDEQADIMSYAIHRKYSSREAGKIVTVGGMKLAFDYAALAAHLGQEAYVMVNEDQIKDGVAYVNFISVETNKQIQALKGAKVTIQNGKVFIGQGVTAEAIKSCMSSRVQTGRIYQKLAAEFGI